MAKTTCHICGNETELMSGLEPICACCGADLTNPASETKYREARTMSMFALKDSFSSPGFDARLYLTDKRFIVVPAKIAGLGLAGAVTNSIVNKMMDGTKLISVPFQDIKGIRDGKFGLFRKALIIDTADGQLVKITCPKLGEWKAALDSRIQ